MKKQYQIPSIEIIKLDNKDIIVMSEITEDTEFCEIFGPCEENGTTN